MARTGMLKFGQRGRLALGLLAMLIFSGAARADTATVLGVSLGVVQWATSGACLPVPPDW